MSHFRRPVVVPLVILLAGLIGLAQQPPAEKPSRTTIPFEEEEKDPPKPPYKRIDVDDDISDVAAASGGYYVRLDPVYRAVATAPHPDLKNFLATFAVAFDRATKFGPKGQPPPKARVLPVPLLWGTGGTTYPPEFGVVPLDDTNKPMAVAPLTRQQVSLVEPFERIAAAEAARVTNPGYTGWGKPPPSRAEILAAAETVLSEVLLFHDKARELGKRRDRGWDSVKAEVNDRLTEVRLARVKQAVADRNWPTVRAMGRTLADRYRTQPKVLEVIWAARLAEAEDGMKADRPGDLERIRELLNEYDARFPKSKDETAARLRKAVADRAAQLFAEAQRKSFSNPTEARNILRTVEGLDPNLDGLRSKMLELKAGYNVLYVGSPRLPERMTPGTARWDSERQAVELLFEGQYAALPDEAVGVRYEPALAADRAVVVGAGVRDVTLVGNAEWAGPDRGYVDPADAAGTLDLLRARPDTWEADRSPWIKDIAPLPAEPGTVRVRFGRGHPDARELLTFKLLPAQWLKARGKAADDPEFARRPFGTGPFRLATGPRLPTGEVVFESNPSYGRRPGRLAQPGLKEVRFKAVAPDRVGDAVEAFRTGNLHVLPDVPAGDLARYQGTPLAGTVRVVREANPRRFHMLAINHRRPPLQSIDLRRGLLHAIDREAILTEVFRGGVKDVHRAMSGPFPPQSWAADKPLGNPAPPLFDRDLAAAKLRAYRDAGGPTSLSLAFTADDPLARTACERLRADLEAAGGGAAGKGVSLQLEPLPPAEFYRRVVDEHRFDLAYLPFDYRDDLYPLDLASFLDPAAAGPGGRNVGGYLASESVRTKEDDDLARKLAEVPQYRDPKRLESLARDLHRRCNEAVPFVPLWHLDRHMVISTAVEVFLDGRTEEVSPGLLDQTTLFRSVGRWRMKAQ